MKKKVLLLIGCLLIIIIAVLGIIFYPKYLAKKDISVLNNEIKEVNNYFKNNNINLDEINELLNEDVTSNLSDLETSIEKYLKDLLDNYKEIKDLIKDKISINDINKDTKKNITEKKEQLNKVKDKLKEIIDKKKEYLSNVDYTDLYQELTDDIDFKYDDIVNEKNKEFDENIKVLDFLNNNKDWKIEEEKLVFNKRNSFESYKKLLNETFSYELVNDKTGPIISANDITITKGTKININDKVKCSDQVDGNVSCKIEGSYDTNKVGTYNIKITATDFVGNKSNKTIKLIVKDKSTNTTTNNSNKPYYIEVIRNQNVVIVYGLDSNNKYTKIVKVFTCSVGKSNTQTPVGTFKTSDKAKWGWLVGNLYGQYYTRIVGSILFHSVPYTKKAKNTLEWDEYNKLGSAASKGCVRLSVRDVKWIYDNCPRGTTVKIYDGKLPSGVSKPSTIKIDGSSPNRGWDPTDSDQNNPWKK